MSLRNLGWAAGAAFALITSAVDVRAAEVAVSASGSWGPGVAPTIFSAPKESWSFSFDEPNPMPGFVVSGQGWDTPTADNLQYTLDGSPVVGTFGGIEFYNAANAGGFDINFNEGTVSLYLGDIGSSGTLSLGSFAATIDVNDVNFPTGSAGTGTVNITALPVPEPATWAIFILGSVGVGATLRRRGGRSARLEAWGIRRRI